MPGTAALITGINGQDGSYLAELLLARGTEVVGAARPGAARGPFVPAAVTMAACDLGDAGAVHRLVADVAPAELYHLAAPTFVPDSWEDPTETVRLVAGATGTVLAAARRTDPDMRVFVASSSEIFGAAASSPQDEDTPPRPRTPYGVAKLAALGLVRTMREHHGQFAVGGILYNHESPRRPERFLPRKVSAGVAAIAAGRSDELVLGDLRAVRDWSHARDVMRGAMLALGADEPGDYVLASGVGHTVGDLVDAAFAAAGLDPQGRVRVDPAFVRAPEPVASIGNPARARARLGWTPEVSFEQLVAEMVAADLAAVAP